MDRILHRRSHPARSAAAARGFTLVELMITLTVLSMIALAIGAVLLSSTRSKNATTNQVESVQAARSALAMIGNDLRSAGYDADESAPNPQPAIAYMDSTEVIMCSNLMPYPDTEAPHSAPLAYDPAGSPKPKKIDGTQWAPVKKYTTGAELIQYTLDVNNDGVIDQNDVSGTSAATTKNPDDYVLMRRVYGDSVGGIAGNNGPYTNEAVALIRKPGGTVPPIYTVYLRGSSTPWSWANGPIPPTELSNVQRIVLKVDAPSSRPDWKGKYVENILSTNVNSTRNIPNLVPTFTVDGYVFNDIDWNHTKGGTESGLVGVTVRLGNTYTGITGPTGYYAIAAPAGTYTLRHTPPSGFGSDVLPDTFVVTLGPSTSQSFPDTARRRVVQITAFDDLNSNGIKDAGEPGKSGMTATITPGGTLAYTDANGWTQLFASAANYSISASAPDSFVIASTNPQTGTMPNGGTTYQNFALRRADTGVVAGKVYSDLNHNGVLDGGETGKQNVWVGVTSDNGTTIKGYDYTDASGDYSISVAVNDPPHTTSYSVFIVEPPGFFGTSATSLGPLWIQSGQTISGKNFGVAAYQIITLSATRVLSLATADLFEQDWGGSDQTTAVKDQDIVLGADTGGTDNISVWFNQYPTTPLFTTSPTYTRNAAGSVMSIALDTLDSNAPKSRPDMVTGTKIAGGKNLFWWYSQNSSGNYGYFKSTPDKSHNTNDNGDVQAVVTIDCAGGAQVDVVAGTKSTTSGVGHIEVWKSNDGATPDYTRDEIYPPAGSIPGGILGEVTSMTLRDLNNDGRKDLIVGTKTGTYSGQMLIFKNVSNTAGNRFVCQQLYGLSTTAVTALKTLDVDHDGYADIVVGTQASTSTGTLQWWRNQNTPSMTFVNQKEVSVAGIVTALARGDLGGTTGEDVAVGWRASESNYAGGVLIYNTDTGTIPSTGTDPSGGSITNWVPALSTGDYNYGVQPAPPSPPFLIDLAVGVKISATEGQLVVLIR